MNTEQRLALIRRVLNTASAGSESFRDHHLGAHLAYLAMAIADERPESFVDWSHEVGDESTEIVLHLFLEWFTPNDPVWKFIRVPK